MLKSLMSLAFAAALLITGAAQAADALFAKAIEDLPLMEGMVEHEDAMRNQFRHHQF